MNRLLQVNHLIVRYYAYLSILVFLFAACQSGRKVSKPAAYPANVGDIAPDPSLDDPGFTVCRERFIPQYYSIKSGFEGEKPAIEAYFREKFVRNKKYKGEDGYITIRFVVNCKGKTGRFRVYEMGPDYLPKKFPAALSSHLLDLTKHLEGWQPGQGNALQWDYYQYLTFTITNGEITQIMP